MPETDDDLATMTSAAAGDAFEAADAALLGTGATEQHSLHLPVSVDSIRAEHLTEELVEAAPDHDLQFVRLPTMPYGLSEHHMNFPGTVTLSEDAYRQVIVDIGTSLATHGVERLVVVNCHGGNISAIKSAAAELTRHHDIKTHFINWTSYARERLEAEFGEGWGHAGEHETSVIEHYRPDLVETEKKEPQNNRAKPETRPYAYYDEVTEKGGLSDPTNSDPEVIGEVIEEATNDILEALNRDIEAGW